MNMNKNKIYLFKINKYKNNDIIKYNKYLNKYNSSGGGFLDLFKFKKDNNQNNQNKQDNNKNKQDQNKQDQNKQDQNKQDQNKKYIRIPNYNIEDNKYLSLSSNKLEDINNLIKIMYKSTKEIKDSNFNTYKDIERINKTIKQIKNIEDEIILNYKNNYLILLDFLRVEINYLIHINEDLNEYYIDIYTYLINNDIYNIDNNQIYNFNKENYKQQLRIIYYLIENFLGFESKKYIDLYNMILELIQKKNIVKQYKPKGDI